MSGYKPSFSHATLENFCHIFLEWCFTVLHMQQKMLIFYHLQYKKKGYGVKLSDGNQKKPRKIYQLP